MRQTFRNINSDFDDEDDADADEANDLEQKIKYAQVTTMYMMSTCNRSTVKGILIQEHHMLKKMAK